MSVESGDHVPDEGGQPDTFQKLERGAVGHLRNEQVDQS